MTEVNVLDPDVEVQVEPDYSGLTQKEAKRVLIAELNSVIQAANTAVLVDYRARRKAWLNGKGSKPADPWFLQEFNLRRLDQAVFKARQVGGYEKLLIAAGYRPKKKRR